MERVHQIRKLFDEQAETYDANFSTSIGQKLRERTWRVIDDFFSPGIRVLDLGCGTGDDAIHLAERGIAVTAVDISPRMISQVEMKSEALGYRDRIHCQVGELESISVQGAPFDGLLSNFAALNCCSDLSGLQGLARRCLKPRSWLIVTVMGRFSPFETGLFLWKRDATHSFRRWRGCYDGALNGVAMRIYYHGLRSLKHSLGSDFELEKAIGLNLLLPAPGQEHIAASYRLLFRSLEPLDRWLGERWPCCSLGEFFVSVWRYRPIPR